MEKQEFYCVKCKDKVFTDEWMEKTSKSNRRMRQGKCPECGTTVTRFIPSKKAE